MLKKGKNMRRNLSERNLHVWYSVKKCILVSIAMLDKSDAKYQNIKIIKI